MKAKVILTLLAASAICHTAEAQFYSYGNEKGSLKWSAIETQTYRLVYPRGLDSLARVYALNLEQVADAVGSSAGYRPNEAFRKKMPVILHPNSSSANGMVSLIPRRMELLTNPEPYSPGVLPWAKDLAIHESRHVSQFQFTRTRGFRFLNVLLGEFGAGALLAVYAGTDFDEGDAVLAETALSDAGRGRSASFLEYMRVSFAAGDWRDYWKWRFGSQNRFTPDHYKVGYITMAGMRTMFDAPEFTKDCFDRIFRHSGIAPFNFQKTVREVSGLRFKDTFREIEVKLDSIWREERAMRAPFIESEEVSAGGRLFTEYSHLLPYGNSLLAVRKGIAETVSLVRLWPDGSEERLHYFSPQTSSLHYSIHDSKVWWTEYARNPRWDLESFSNLRCMELDGRVRTLTRGRRFFNPAPSDDGLVAVVEYLSDGSEKVVTLDAQTGKEADSWKVPDGFQAIEPVWNGGRLYVSSISDAGYGIYEVPGFRTVLPPIKAGLKRLSSREGRFIFTSDIGGTDELYSYDPDGNVMRRLTSTPDGAGDFAFEGDTLYYTMLRPEGRAVYKTAISGLQDSCVDISRTHRYAMADKLSEQETVAIPEDFTAGISEVSEYRKATHFLKVHSWLPLYFNCDDVSNLSFETIYQNAGIGATAFFQNELSTVSGLAGIHADHRAGWRPSGHLKLTCTGLYPVFELQADFNDRPAGETVFRNDPERKKIVSDSGPAGNRPLAYASIRTYIPLAFSSGGWNRGLVPQIKFAMSNDILSMEQESGRSTVKSGAFTASFRGYTMRGIPSSGIFPRFGIGAEAGYHARPGFTDVFCANAYGFVYGYLPGLLDTHGIKITAGVQGHASDGILCEAHMNTAPRGFSSSSVSYLSAYPLQTKLTADYALPFAPVGWSGLGSAAYVRNFELTLHADYGLYRSSSGGTSLFSAGADLAVRLGNFLCIPYDTRIGAGYSYLGGKEFGPLVEGGREKSRHSVELLFSIDF